MRTELQHHGILGQKWGVRRYQNPDGSLTDAGKKRLAKNLAKEARPISFAQPYKRSDKFKNDIRKELTDKNIITSDDKKRLHTLKEDYQNKLHEYFSADYYDSEEYEKDTQKAYEETINWFKKNDKEYLDTIVKSNNGSFENLDYYHDFRKVNDGYLDEYWSKGEEKYNETHNFKTIENELNNVEKEYKTACKEVGEKLLGNYGNVTVTEASKYVSAVTLNDEISDIIQSVIHEEYLQKKNNKNS